MKTLISGTVFNFLTAIKFSHTRTKDGVVTGGAVWFFKCECGNEHIADLYKVKTGKIKSCGCQKTTLTSVAMKELYRTEKIVSHFKTNPEVVARGLANRNKEEHKRAGAKMGHARLGTKSGGRSVATDENATAKYWVIKNNDTIIEGFNLRYLIRTHSFLFDEKDVILTKGGCKAYVSIANLVIGKTWKGFQLLNKENRNFYN